MELHITPYKQTNLIRTHHKLLENMMLQISYHVGCKYLTHQRRIYPGERGRSVTTIDPQNLSGNYSVKPIK
jgi:hypothetical protein